MKQIHNIEPLYDKNAKILILGSFPSQMSRETGFFYGYPKNRFWNVLAIVFGCHTPISIEEKRTFILSHNIALWDVLASCDIKGSADSSIKKAEPNDISPILDDCDIKEIFVNGKTAQKYYERYIEPKTGRKAIYLPSTSPANASWSLERLVDAWRIITDVL